MNSDAWAGSPSAKLRFPPHVVFLIDFSFLKYPFYNSPAPEEAFERLVLILERILVYFHRYVDSRFRWGVQCFDALDNPDISAVSRGHFHELSGDSFKKTLIQLKNEFNRIANTNESKRSKPLIENISIRLAQVLSDFAWHENPLLNAARLEPEARENELVPIKNYLYVLSLLPQNYLELLCWLDGKIFDVWNDQIRYYITGRKPDYNTLSNRIQSHLITRGLCEGYLKSGISLNWINTRNLISSNVELDIFGELAKTYLGNALEAFGGVVIPLEPFLTTPVHMPFSAFFKHFRKRHIDPKVGRKLLEPSSLAVRSKHADNPPATALIFPSGHQCSLIITTLNSDTLTLKSKSATNPEISPKIHQFRTGEILFRFRPLFSSFDQILCSVDRKFLCFSSHTILEDTASFTELLQFLLRSKQALILNLELLTELSSEMAVTVAPSENSSTNTRYGILEAVTETSGILTLLKSDIDEQHIVALAHPTLKVEKEDDRATSATSFSPFYLESWWSDDTINDMIGEEVNCQSDIAIDCEAPITPEIKIQENILHTSSVVAELPAPLKSDEDQVNISHVNEATGVAVAKDSQEDIRDAYFKALYNIKTPLHEFVEAAMNNQSCIEKPQLFEYLEFLCSTLILDLATLEEKYKSIIPSLLSQQEVPESTELSKQELDHFKIWAQSQSEPDLRNNHTHELKIREIYLQIILLLEFMRVRRVFKDHLKASNLAPVNIDETKVLSKSQVLARLDVFWDRLFIWVSIGSGGMFSAEEKEDPGYDAMRKFYNHVCYKYYRSSIPEIIKVIVKKIKSDMMPSVHVPPKIEPKSRRRNRVMKDKIPNESPSPLKGNRRTIMEINAKRNEIIFNNPLFRNREVSIQKRLKYDENKPPENGQPSKRKRKPFSPDNSGLLDSNPSKRVVKSPLFERAQDPVSVRSFASPTIMASPTSIGDQRSNSPKLIVAQSPEHSPARMHDNFIPRTPERVASDNEEIFVAESPT